MSHLRDELLDYGPNVLLVYGHGSIKANGIYSQVMQALSDTGKQVSELSGVSSNPRYSQVLAGCELVRSRQIDLILAVGGGSVIDCSKAISAGSYCDDDPWQHYWERRLPLPEHIVPVAAVLTMCGTASEMNSTAVITNESLKIKAGYTFPMSSLTPRFSILNPEFTYTVPMIQMVSGAFDVFSHLMEQYFGGEGDTVSDYLLEGGMNALISCARASLRDPSDYEARSNLMWSATMGLNKILSAGKLQDWEVHQIEHQIGAYCDCPHGVGLAIISVPYYRIQSRYAEPHFVRYALNVWHVDPDGKTPAEIAQEGISCLSCFIDELGIPRRLSEVGCTREMLPLIARSCNKIGGYHVVTTEEVMQILEEVF